MVRDIISQNVNFYEGDILLVDSYIPDMYPEILSGIAKGRPVFSFCPELTHLDVLGLKLTTIFRLGKVSSVTVVTKDGSPHTVQIPFMVQEAAENAGFDKRNISYHAIEKGRAYEIDDLTVRKARHLSMIEELLPFARLQKTTELLCGENGCPNDRKETCESVVAHLREEVEEIAEALEKKDDENFLEEVGDVLFNLCLLMDISRRGGKGEGGLPDVADRAASKMISRHTGIFDAIGPYKY